MPSIVTIDLKEKLNKTLLREGIVLIALTKSFALFLKFDTLKFQIIQIDFYRSILKLVYTIYQVLANGFFSHVVIA